MKFPLRPLALHVYHRIKPSQILQSTEATEKAKQTALQLAGTVQMDFISRYLKCSKNKAQTGYTHAIQCCLVNLADTIHKYMAEVKQLSLPKTELDACMAFYQPVAEQLYQALEFLETNYQEAFNREQKMPNYYCLPMQEYFQESVTKLEAQIDKGISPQLIQLITELIQTQIRELPRKPLTYRLYDYWINLLPQLLQAADDAAYIQILILNNFNHGNFINYLMDSYEHHIAINTGCEPIEQWAKYLRAMNRQHPVPGIALHKNSPGCKQQILAAIKAEIHLQKLQPASPQQKTEGIMPIKTTLSAPQLGVYLKVHAEAGIFDIDANKKKEFLKNAAGIFHSKRAGTITYESLHNKFYTPDPAAVSMMQTHFARMMSFLKTYGSGTAKLLLALLHSEYLFDCMELIEL